MMLSGKHNVLERCIFDSNKDSSLQISRSSSSITNSNDFPSDNYIINCDLKDNCDPATYENADGFAAKLTNSQAMYTSDSFKRGEVISIGTSASDFTNSIIPAVGTSFFILLREL